MSLMMRMMDAWVRGSNPVCGWIRLFLLPAMLIPVWFGYALGGMVVMTVWMMLPMAFRKPISQSAWMTRAMLGVQLWRSRPLDDPGCLLFILLSGVGLIVGMGGAMQQHPLATGSGVALYFLSYGNVLARCASRLLQASRPGGL